MKKRNQTIVKCEEKQAVGRELDQSKKKKRFKKKKNKRKVHFDRNKLRNPEWPFIFKRDLKQIVELMKFQLSYFSPKR